MPGPSDPVTLLLAQLQDGRQDAWEKLVAVVYRELRAMAHAAMRKEEPGQTLQTTALVHEAYLRLVKDRQGWKNSEHFFSAAARAIRRILVDRARIRKAQKRGHGRRPVPLEELAGREPAARVGESRFDDLEELDKALERLASHEAHRRKATIVELIYFVGLTPQDTAEALGISRPTVTRDWTFARAWLQREMTRAG